MLDHRKILIISLLACFSLFFLADFSFAAGRQLEVPIPGLETTTLPALPDYIVAIYNFALMIIGIICLGALIYGGFRYLISAGNPSAMADGRDQIFSALLGLIVLFCSYLILTTINPELVILNQPVRECATAVDCPEGQKCIEGFCGVCAKNEDCLQTCVEERCSQSGNICDGTPCPSLVCVERLCALPGGSWSSCLNYPSSSDCTDAGCTWCPACSGLYLNKWGKDICLEPGVSCEYQTTECSEACSPGGRCEVCERWDATSCSCIPSSCCLKEGSLILTLDGFKKIEDLKEGNYVIGYKDGEKVKSKVLAKSEHTGEFDLYFYKGYWFTENHLIYLDDYKDFKPVTELSNLTEYFNGKVYNIQTETKNYFGENNLLIHNK